MRTRTLVLTTLLCASMTPASAGEPPSYRVEWSRAGMSAPYTLATYHDRDAGDGVYAVGYAGGVAAVGPSGVRWRFGDGTQLAHAVAADLTGDGVDEAILGQYSQLTVLDGRDGEVLTQHPLGRAPEGLATGEATGDGRTDLYTVTQGRGVTNTIALWDGDTLEPVWQIDLGWDKGFVLASSSGDLDGDGLDDLLFGTYENGPMVHAYRSTGAKLWEVGLGGAISNIEVADGGRTILASVTGTLLASLDGRTGATRWTLPGPGGFSRMKAADLNADGTDDAAWALYGASGKSPAFQVMAVDGTDGLPLWTAPTLTPPKGLAVGDIDGDGRPDVAATTQDPFGTASQQQNFVWAFHGGTGRTLWTHALTGEQTTFLSDVVLADVTGDSADEVVAAPYFDTLLGLSGRDGARVWDVPLGSSVGDAVAVDLDGDGSQEIVEGSNDFRVTARSMTNGAVRWSRDLGGEIVSLSTLTAGSGRDVLAISLSRVVRLRGSDGAALWSHQLPGWGTRALATQAGVVVGARLPRAVRGNNALADHTAGSLTLLDPATGQPRWHQPTVGAAFDLVNTDVNGDGAADLVTATPVTQAGITAYDGARLATAAVPLWQAATEAGVSGMGVSGGRVYAALPSVRKVVALDATTGASRWSVSPDTQAVRWVGFEDVNADGTADPLVATKLFAERIVALNGTTGAALFDAPAGLRFVKAARWQEVSGDASRDLVFASDGGTYGQGGVVAVDGATLQSGEPKTLWSFGGVNAYGLAPAAHPDGPAFLAFGGSVRPASLALIRAVPEQE